MAPRIDPALPPHVQAELRAMYLDAERNAPRDDGAVPGPGRGLADFARRWYVTGLALARIQERSRLRGGRLSDADARDADALAAERADIVANVATDASTPAQVRARLDAVARDDARMRATQRRDADMVRRYHRADGAGVAKLRATGRTLDDGTRELVLVADDVRPAPRDAHLPRASHVGRAPHPFAFSVSDAMRNDDPNAIPERDAIRKGGTVATDTVAAWARAAGHSVGGVATRRDTHGCDADTGRAQAATFAALDAVRVSAGALAPLSYYDALAAIADMVRTLRDAERYADAWGGRWPGRVRATMRYVRDTISPRLRREFNRAWYAGRETK